MSRLNLTKVEDYLYTVNCGHISPELADKLLSFVDADTEVACTSVRKGSLHARNFDWYYSEEAEFVVFCGGHGEKYASVGIASLSEVENCAADIYSYVDGSGPFELHFMISDPEKTAVIEFVDNEMVVLYDEYIITNFYLALDEYTEHAMGIERYEFLKEAYADVSDEESMLELMEGVWYSKAYTETDPAFSFGDSCDVVFSNGLSYTDIPFYNGYYVRTGLPLVVGYPGYPYLAITRNNAGLWTDSGLSDGDTVTITLHAAGSFISVQEALSQSYSDDRSEYSTDGQFANLRALSGGSLREDFLFRGASPCNNEKNRAP